MSDKQWFEENQALLNDVIAPEEVDILQKSKTGFLTWDEMMKMPHEENNYLIDKFLWEGQVCMLLAKEKVGKSILSKQMICSLTSGKALFNEYDVARPCKVCYLQLEGDRGETKSRFTSMSKGLPVGAENFYWRFYDRLMLDKDTETDKLIAEIVDHEINPDVLFIDPIYMALSGSLSDDKVVREMIGNIRRLQSRFDCAIVLVHHEHRNPKNKDGKYIDEGDNAIMGSFAFKAFVSHVIRVTRPKKDDPTRILTCDTQRNAGVESRVSLTLQNDPLMYKKQVGTVPKGMADTVYRYIKKHDEGVSVVDFINTHQSCPSTVRQAFTALSNVGRIRKSGRKGKGQVIWVSTNTKEEK